MQFNISVFEGHTYTVEKRNVFRDSKLLLPEGSLLLHSEVVLDGDNEGLEVWVAIPEEAPVTAGTYTKEQDTLPVVDLSEEDVEDYVEEDLEDFYF